MENKKRLNWYGSSEKRRRSRRTFSGYKDRQIQRDDQMEERTNASERNFEEHIDSEWRRSSETNRWLNKDEYNGSPEEFWRRRFIDRSREERNKYSETYSNGDDILSSRESNRQSRKRHPYGKSNARNYSERDEHIKTSLESLNRAASREDHEDSARDMQGNPDRGRSYYRSHDRWLTENHDQNYFEDARDYKKSKRTLKCAEQAERGESHLHEGIEHRSHSVYEDRYLEDGEYRESRNEETSVQNDEDWSTDYDMYGNAGWGYGVDDRMQKIACVSRIDSYLKDKPNDDFHMFRKDRFRTSREPHQDRSSVSDEHSENSEYNNETTANGATYLDRDNRKYKSKDFDTKVQSFPNKFKTQRLPKSKIIVDGENERIVEIQPDLISEKRKVAAETRNTLKLLKKEINHDLAGAIVDIFATGENDISVDDIWNIFVQKNIQCGRRNIENVLKRKLKAERNTSSHDEIRYKMDVTELCKSLKLCNKYSTTASQEQCTCDALHICKFFMLSACTFKQCKFGHTLKTEHNIRVLRKRFLQNLTLKQLKNFIRQKESRNETTLPGICTFYNSQEGCKHDEDQTSECPFLHACYYHIKRSCKFGRACKRSHVLLSGQPLRILKLYGLNHLTPEEILDLFDKISSKNEQTNNTAVEETEAIKESYTNGFKKIDTDEEVDFPKRHGDYISLEMQNIKSRRYFHESHGIEFKQCDTSPDTSIYPNTLGQLR